MKQSAVGADERRYHGDHDAQQQQPVSRCRHRRSEQRHSETRRSNSQQMMFCKYRTQYVYQLGTSPV